MWKLNLTVVTLAIFIAQFSGHARGGLVGDCVAIEFVTTGCDQCRAMDATTQHALADGWVVRRVNVQQEPHVAQRWRIHTTPTTLLVRGTREIDRILGPVDYMELSRRMVAASNPDKLKNNPNTTAIAPSLGPANTPRVPTSAAELAPTPRNSYGFPTTKPSEPPKFVRNQAIEPITQQPINPQPALGSLNTSFQDPSPVQKAQHLVPVHPNGSSANSTAANNTNTNGISNAARATVRIRVDDPRYESVGTGTIIDSYQGEALVLTCGHLFRDLPPNARITVEMFPGPNERIPGREEKFEAQVIDFQAADLDIGLLSFHPGRDVARVPLIAQRESLREGEPVFSIGCDNGQPPSRRDSKITKLNRYMGAPNVEVAGAPVQGRSGGGLFNAKGELIGICYAADNELDEGLYSAPMVVYHQLSKLGLQRLYSGPTLDAIAIAPTAEASPSLAETSPSPVIPASNNMTVILRDPQGRQQQIQIQSPSPKLLQALAEESSSMVR
jgi:S1-C subfamily serine protease